LPSWKAWISEVGSEISPRNFVSKDTSLARTVEGFTLIEVIVALLISAMIGVALITSFNQFNNTARNTDVIIDFDTRMAMVSHQLAKDIAGAFIPLQAVPEPPAEKQQPKDQKTPPPKTAEKPKQKPLKKIFMSSNDESGSIKTVTCITNNPLIGYGNAKPRMSRVMYRLAKNKEDKGVYTLYRQESTTELDAESFKPENKKIREYPVVNNIKKLSVEYAVEQNKDNAEKGSAKLITSKDWDSDKKTQEYSAQQKKAQEKKEKPPVTAAAKKESEKPEPAEEENGPFQLLPQYATFTITLWDTNKKSERTFTRMVNIPASAIFPEVKAAAAPPPTPAPAAPTPKGLQLSSSPPPSLMKLFMPGPKVQVAGGKQ
jgi:prepilin-type N-terminal cleavage/methylation domain-containing protein